MQLDELRKRFQQVVTGKIDAAHVLARDVFRDIRGSTVGGVEGDSANRLVKLP
jgi:hypothetical protein